MQGNQKVIEQFQKLIDSELSAVDQYFMHARMYADWGLSQLEERITHEAEEEREHVQALIDRMLFLEATPDLSRRIGLKIGKNVIEMLKSDLEYEYSVAEKLRFAINVCEQEKDFQSRKILVRLLSETEEDHMYWLEQQLDLIEKMGLENYIQSKR